MRNNATRAIEEGLVHEGGYVNHPKDPGGATNKGITIATFRRYVKPKATIQDLKNLTNKQAIHIYRQCYWDAVSGDQLPSGIDIVVYDFAINSGPSRAAKSLQEALGVTADGKIGPQTIDACEACVHTKDFVNKICDDRLAFMKRIKNGALWVTFGRGWQTRVDSVRKSGLELAGRPQKLQPKTLSPKTSRTINAVSKQRKAAQGGSIVLVGSVLTQVSEAVLGGAGTLQEAAGSLQGLGEYFPIAGGLLAVVGIGFFVYSRWQSERIEHARVDDYEKGLR